MPINPEKRRRPTDYEAPTSSARRRTESPVPVGNHTATAVSVPATRPPRAVNARVDADLADALDERLTDLLLPRGAAHGAALRALLALDDDALREQVSAEMVRQKQDQIRRRSAR